MHPATFLSFKDELQKIKEAEAWRKPGSLSITGKGPWRAPGRVEKVSGVMEDAAHEGIAMAKKLKAKNLVGGLRGNTLKDYYHHMDLSAHPKFMQGVKATVQGPMGKAASMEHWTHAAELAGLGTLAAPTIQKMRGKPMSEENTNRAELGGLGVLAAPSAISMGKTIAGKLKGVGKAVAKHASANLDLVNSALFLFQKKAAPVQLGIGAMGKHMLGDAWKAGKGMAAAAKPAAKMVADPRRASMLGHFTPPSQVNMSRAISL
jgi:hypothetical protein